jgi:hypothetical protein
VMAGVHYLQSTDLYRGYLRLRMLWWFVMCKLYKTLQQGSTGSAQPSLNNCALASWVFRMKERAFAFCARCSCMFRAQKVCLCLFSRGGRNEPIVTIALLGAWPQPSGGNLVELFSLETRSLLLLSCSSWFRGCPWVWSFLLPLIPILMC